MDIERTGWNGREQTHWTDRSGSGGTEKGKRKEEEESKLEAREKKRERMMNGHSPVSACILWFHLV